MVFVNLFGQMDKVGAKGFLFMWFSFFFTSFGVMLADNTVGSPRNFCAVSQMICCTNLVSIGYAITNKVPLSKASQWTSGLDMFVTWTSFAYFGGTAVFSTTPIGIWNWIQVPLMAVMTIPTVVGFFAIAFNEDGYQEYLNKEDKKGENRNLELNEVVVENEEDKK
tara:strand:- start:153 stop:650 length:498 start_codon:yes stop_codon:yes gene_type:complete